jgi:hypothetical protein
LQSGSCVVVDVVGEVLDEEEPVSLGTVVPPVASLDAPPSCGMVAPPVGPAVVVVELVVGVVDAGTEVVGTVVVGTVVVSTVGVCVADCVCSVSVLTQVTESLELPHPEARNAPAARSARRLVRGSSIAPHRSDAHPPSRPARLRSRGRELT